MWSIKAEVVQSKSVEIGCFGAADNLIECHRSRRGIFKSLTKTTPWTGKLPSRKCPTGSPETDSSTSWTSFPSTLSFSSRARKASGRPTQASSASWCTWLSGSWPTTSLGLRASHQGLSRPSSTRTRNKSGTRFMRTTPILLVSMSFPRATTVCVCPKSSE